ncbi:hypothetical protein [Sphingomonas sp. Leaf17]|uniref:hypothetical protein n=1 Tax=Sphingomonas sp. Leaf17 TaxID=1735683 RepID=UPI0012E3170F|nr:hypothetical protein [Sphingomonas sp. Leaf17]
MARTMRVVAVPHSPIFGGGAVSGPDSAGPDLALCRGSVGGMMVVRSARRVASRVAAGSLGAAAMQVVA